MFPHVSSAHPHPLFVRHRRLIHASSEAIIGAWCDPALFTSLDTIEPHIAVTFSIDPAATHRASITLGTPPAIPRNACPSASAINLRARAANNMSPVLSPTRMQCVSS